MHHSHTGTIDTPWARKMSKYYRSAGYPVMVRLSLIGLSHYVFAANFKELSNLLTQASTENAADRLIIPTNKEERLIIEYELPRLLHNYLASAKTLIDTVRAEIREAYQDTAFVAEYQDEVDKRFKDNPLAGFIQDLRNYSLHYRLPIVDAQIWGKASTNGTKLEGPTSGITYALDTQRLAKWPNWSNGRQFLREAGCSIKLADLLASYTDQVEDFHSWLDRRLREIHSEELAETAELRRQMENSLSHL